MPLNFRTPGLSSLAVAAALVCGAHESRAADFPTKPVRIVLPFSAGGAPDVLLRIVAPHLSDKWKQPVVIENRPGANTNIGTVLVTKAEPDGHTLLFTTDGTFIFNPLIYSSMPYAVSELAPISLVATAHHMLAVGTHVPATTVAELVALARSKPGAINYGSTGPASIQRLQMEYFMALTGTQFTHVPFKGANETTMAMLANQMDATITASSNVLPHLPTGKLRALAITTVDRTPQAPDVPTMQEAGVKGYETYSVFGLFAPAGTPKDIIARLNAETIKAMNNPELKSFVQSQGAEAAAGTPEQLGALFIGDAAYLRGLTAGARSLTSTSGPGVSLMSEFAGLAYYAEVPAVVCNVQRVGPSTGLPTRTAQGDILSTAVNSHGDTKHPLLLPGSVEECYEMTMASLDLAEKLQTMVYVMSDLDLGMNTWMSNTFTYPAAPIERGKVLDEAKVRELGASWGRYKDVDGDGIPWRSLPDTKAPAYFTRGSGHNAMAAYSEKPDDYQNNLDRLARKFETAKHLVPQPVVDTVAGASIGIIAYGSTDPALVESRDQLKEEHGIATSYLRLRAYPFTADVHEFIRRHDRVYVVEQNRDAQMRSLLLMDGDPSQAGKLRSVLHYNGLPIDARSITDAILKQEGK